MLMIYSRYLLSGLTLIALSITIASGSANAAAHHCGHSHHNHDHDTKLFYGHAHVLLHGDSVINADEDSEEIAEAYTHAHIDFGINITDNLSVQSSIKLDGHPSGFHGHNHGHENDGGDVFGRTFFISRRINLQL